MDSLANWWIDHKIYRRIWCVNERDRLKSLKLIIRIIVIIIKSYYWIIIVIKDCYWIIVIEIRLDYNRKRLKCLRLNYKIINNINIGMIKLFLL